MNNTALKIEIDGSEFDAHPGEMVIQVADRAGIYIPRFCYHEKLSVAANCRMCLVEVAKAPKPLPACATPVVDGMKVSTASKCAVSAQKDTLEFLLINHPLDCPICDQGGECPLQDQAVGYGGDSSRFTEKKRVVADHSVGPLIKTEMTRCIHCTRCVRFGEEIAGVMEFGITGRGEHLKIDTFFESSVDSEVSGNVIDLCPVGALTSKPYRFTARSWELINHESISPHDCLGTNINIQTLRGEVKRVLPRVNESINECWISDRDRYSYEALVGKDRLTQPMIRTEEGLVSASWQDALERAVSSLKAVIDGQGASALAALISPTSTFEEFYLMQRLMRAIGSDNVDHRLRQIDFSQDESAPLYPRSELPIEKFPSARKIVLIGSNVRKEQPLLGLRIRKAALAGAKVMAVNPMAWQFNFPLVSSAIVSPGMIPYALAQILQELCVLKSKEFPSGVSDEFLSSAKDFPQSEDCKEIARILSEQEGEAVLVLGQSAHSHPMRSCIEHLARLIGGVSEASISVMSPSNSVAGWIAGCLPHRTINGKKLDNHGLNVRQLIHNPRSAYLLFNVEPEKDVADGLHAAEAMSKADLVISFQAYRQVPDYVDIALPLAPYTENAGTFINCEGRLQKSTAATEPEGEARPGWKVLRVLGNFLNLPGFDYVSLDDIVAEAQPKVSIEETDVAENGKRVPCVQKHTNLDSGRFELISDPLIYSVDPIVRRANSLQLTADASPSQVGLNPKDMKALALDNGSTVTLRHDLYSIQMQAVSDSRVVPGCVYYPAGLDASPSAANAAEVRIEAGVSE